MGFNKQTKNRINKKRNSNNFRKRKLEISKESNIISKLCKILGSLLDIKLDINRRKSLATMAYEKFKDILQSKRLKRLSMNIKLRIYKTYISNVCYYIIQRLWTITKDLETKLDVFQRKPLRKLLGYIWPKTISNEKLYDTTKIKPVSKIIKDRR